MTSGGSAGGAEAAPSGWQPGQPYVYLSRRPLRWTGDWGVARQLLAGSGEVAVVKCIPPLVVAEFHSGYQLDEDDYHDVKALCERFDIPLPDEYRKFEGTSG